MSEIPKEWAFLTTAWQFALLLTGCEDGASKVFDETVEEIARHPHPGDLERTKKLFFGVLRRRALKFPARCALAGAPAALHQSLEPGRSAIALLALQAFDSAEIERILGIDHRTLTAAGEKTRASLRGGQSALEDQPDPLGEALAALPVPPAAETRIVNGAHNLAEHRGGARNVVSNPATIAVGLGFLLLVAVLVWTMLGRAGVFPEEAIKLAATGVKAGPDRFEAVDTTLDGLQDWLMLKGFDSFRVPPGLENMKTVGVRTFKYENEPVAQALVLENRMSVYSFNGRSLGITIPEKTWVIGEGEWLALAIRGENDNYVLLAFRGNKEQMRKVLEEAGAVP